MIACWFGCNPPPKNPCISRNTISSGRLVAMPQRKLNSVKQAMQVRKYRLRPKTLPSQAEIGSTMPFATR